jgi:mannosyltransferase
MMNALTAAGERTRSTGRAWLASDRSYLWVLTGITILAAVLRVAGLGSEPFWLDEAHTANFTKLTLGELWSFDPVYDSANPPGYIVLMKAWVQVSRSEEWFRASSLIASVGTVPLIYLICARMGNRRAGLVASATMAFAGYQVRYSQEARSYAILTFLVAIAILAVVQLVTEPNGDLAQKVLNRPWFSKARGDGLRRQVTWTDVAWLAYGLAVGFALHMHNTSLTIPLAANVGVGMWWVTRKPNPPRFVRNWFLANLLALTLWAPWIPGFLNQLERVDRSFWASLPTLRSAMRDFAVLAKGDLDKILPFTSAWWVDAIVLAGVIVLIWLGIRRIGSTYRPVILSFIVVHPIALLLLSLRRPVFLGRTLIWITIATLVAMAFAVSPLTGRRFVLATAGLLVLPVVSTVGYHVGFEKTPWDEAASIVAAEAGPGDFIFVMSPNNVVPFRHYFDRYETGVDPMRLPTDLPVREQEDLAIYPSDLDVLRDVVADSNRVWLVLNRAVLVTNYEAVDPMLRSEARAFEVHRLGDLSVVEYEMR